MGMEPVWGLVSLGFGVQWGPGGTHPVVSDQSSQKSWFEFPSSTAVLVPRGRRRGAWLDSRVDNDTFCCFRCMWCLFPHPCCPVGAGKVDVPGALTFLGEEPLWQLRA